METLILTSPEVIPQIVTTDYRVSSLLLDTERARIVILLRGTNGERKQCEYEGADATTLMTALNKTNLATKSLHRRILERLVADGKIDGAVNGSPD